jgi:hypothetical protein
MDKTNAKLTFHPNQKPHGGFALGNKIGNRFKPGQTGNPNGRHGSLRDEFDAWVQAKQDKGSPKEIAWAKLYALVRKGNIAAMKILFEWSMSKPPQDINLGGQSGNPVNIYNIIDTKQKEKLEHLHNSADAV